MVQKMFKLVVSATTNNIKKRKAIAGVFLCCFSKVVLMNLFNCIALNFKGAKT